MTRFANAARRTGAWILLVGIAVRALSATVTLPWWDLDPASAWTPITGLTPAWGLVLDALMLAAAALVFGLGGRRGGGDGRGRALMMLGGVIVALLPTVLHGFVLGSSEGVRGSLPDLALGSAWSAAIVAALALFAAARDDSRLRAAAMGVLVGLAVPLAARGVVQVTVELPAIAEQFRANPGAMLGAQGIDPSASAARLLERRMNQFDATGWFSLSNVYGSVVGACAVALLGWTIVAWRGARRGELTSGESGVITLGFLIALVGLALSHSKGAIAAALLGGGLVVARWVFLSHRRWPARLIGWGALALVGSALGAIVVRGIVGERLGELSLLFRWHYAIGAARIMLEHAAFGVGPTGFQDAYLLARPALSPEEVESPHSVVLDWAARLGALGWVWAAMLTVAVYKAGASFGAREPLNDVATAQSERAGSRSAVLFAGSATIVAGLIGLFIERALLTPDVLLVRIVAILGWAVLAIVAGKMIERVGGAGGAGGVERAACAALAAAGIAMTAHAQIEMTPVLAGSCGFFAAFVAMGALAQWWAIDDASPTSPPGGRSVMRAVAGLLMLAALVWSTLALPRALRWEATLERAAGEVRSLSEVRAELALATVAAGAPARLNDGRAAMERALAVLSRESGQRVTPDREAIGRALFALQDRAFRNAEQHLARADRLAPSDPRPLTKAINLMVELAFAAHATGAPAEAELLSGRALAHASALTARFPRRAGVWSRHAAVLEARHGMFNRAEDARGALECWSRVALLDPWGVTAHARMALLYKLLGDAAGAADSARRALTCDDAKRLDPLKQLTSAQRVELERLASLERAP